MGRQDVWCPSLSRMILWPPQGIDSPAEKRRSHQIFGIPCINPKWLSIAKSHGAEKFGKKASGPTLDEHQKSNILLEKESLDSRIFKLKGRA